MGKNKGIPETRILGNRNKKNRGQCGTLKNYKVLLDVTTVSKSYKTQSKRGQQRYIMKRFFLHWDFVLQIV